MFYFSRRTLERKRENKNAETSVKRLGISDMQFLHELRLLLKRIGVFYFTYLRSTANEKNTFVDAETEFVSQFYFSFISTVRAT